MIGIIILAIVLVLLGFMIMGIFKLKLEENNIDSVMIAAGLGLGTFILLSVLFSLVHIPIVWYVYIIIGIVGTFLLRKRLTLSEWKWDSSHILAGAVICLFVINLGIFEYGAFKYTWLEDDDPWHHATVTRYIAEEKTMFEPAGYPDMLKYEDHYPDSFNVLAALVYQIVGEMIPSLKTITIVIAALCIPFAYIFFKRLFQNRYTALLAAIILMLIPSFLTHLFGRLY